MKIVQESINQQKLDELYAALQPHLNRSFIGSVIYQNGQRRFAVAGTIRIIQRRSSVLIEAPEYGFAFEVLEKNIEGWRPIEDGAHIDMSEGHIELAWAIRP